MQNKLAGPRLPSDISFCEKERCDDDPHDDNAHDKDAIRGANFGLILRIGGECLVEAQGRIRVLCQDNWLVEICDCQPKDKDEA